MKDNCVIDSGPRPPSYAAKTLSWFFLEL